MHLPVMADEVIRSLKLEPGYIVMDATIGGGGHSLGILNRISPGGKLIGLDADGSAIVRAREVLKDFQASVILVNENFRNLDHVLRDNGIEKLNAIMFDIGISSFQMDDASRGFSFQNDARLDMRMDPRLSISAWNIVNEYREAEIADIIYQYGEERASRRIAKYIVQSRQEKSIDTTFELRMIVHRAIRSKWQRIDPATRTFQALRVAVNDELGALEEGLDKGIRALGTGGKIAVVSFHSLEDRIVKNKFKSYALEGIVNIETKKPLIPTDSEVLRNPRSRSAKLRIAERI